MDKNFMDKKMISKISISLIMALLFSCSSILASRSHLSEKDKNNLLGPVKQVSTFSNLYNMSISTIRSFRENGSIERLEIKSNTALTITYDEKGRVIRSEGITSDGKKSITSNYYDDDSYQYIIRYQKEGFSREVSGRLSTSGNFIDYYEYEPNGDYRGKTISEYNANGLVSERNYYNSVDKHFLKVTYRYNDIGLCVLETAYRDNGTISRRNENIYDEHGRCLEYSRYESDPYDDSECILKYKERVTFDQNGRQIESEVYYHGDRLNTIMIYSDFDKYGNWQRQIKKYGDQKEQLLLRKIEYY